MRRIFHKTSSYYMVSFLLLLFCAMFSIDYFSPSANATCHFLTQFGRSNELTAEELNVFSQNDILFYDPSECVTLDSNGTLAGTGDFDAIMKAKNADKYYFNYEGNVPSAHWSDTDLDSLKTALETYGDLAYQLGRAIGAPWVAIFVQMRYEDAYSVCGANNFWGNGCPVSRAYPGGATIQGKNLGEGFVQYGKTLTETKLNGDELWYAPVLGISDPKEYLEKLGPRWVQGTVDGPGYGSIEGEKASIDVVMDYITNGEGKSIVESFTNYNGIDYGGSGGSSSSSSEPPSGEDITWIGDSYSVGAHSIIEEKFPGISFGSGIENANSYIQSNKGVSDRYGGGDANPPALTILKKLADNNELKPYLVMAVGTNMGWDDDEVNEFNNIMSSHSSTKVVFVTAKAKAALSAETDGTNERLKALADSNDNYYLADWAAAYDETYFANNSTHPDANGGYEKWVEVIYDVLSNMGGCVSYDTSVSDYPQYTQQTDHTCGPTSMAMLATVAAGQDVLESDVIEIVGSDEAYVNTVGSGMVALDQKVGEKYGFSVEQVSVSEGNLNDVAAKMKEYLNNGYMIHMSGCGCTISPTCGCHYTGMFKINGDKVFLADSAGNNRDVDLVDYVTSGYHGDAFSAIKVGGNKNACDSYCEDGPSTSHSGGFNSLEEAESVVMDPYRDMAANHPEDWGKYNITAGTPYNCFSFSNYFISRYTTISGFYGVPGVDGGGYAEEFYNLYHGSYPDITLSDKPTPFSVAGCGDKYYNGANYSHTFIVLGVDTANDTMIYGEAAYGYGSGGVIANQISLSDTSWGSRNGSTGICQYADFSKYVTGL